jgi:type I restriction enzyme S subunit
MSKHREMPKTWLLCKLGDVCTTTSGGTPNRKESKYYGGNIPWVKSGELNHNIIIDTEEKITKEAIENSSAKIFPKGTLLIALYGATIGKLASLGVNAATNQAVCGVYENEYINSKYLFNYLFFKRQDLIKESIGGAQPNISQTILKNLEIPLSPLPEQKIIFNKIEELFSDLDNAVENLQKAREQLKVYRQSILKNAFEGKLTNRTLRQVQGTVMPVAETIDSSPVATVTEPVEVIEATNKEGELPKGWVNARLKELVDKISDGPFGSNLKTVDYVDKGVRVIRLENIGHMRFRNEYATFVSKDKYESIKKHTVSKGDLVFSSFISENVRAAIIPDFIDKAINKADCFLVRSNADKVNNKYLLYYFSTKEMYRQLIGKIHGATRPRINTTQLKLCHIPLAPIDEQQYIVTEIESRFSVCDQMEDTIETSLKQAEALRQSILKQAFDGKLTEQWRKDHPDLISGENSAAALLAKIKAEKKALKKITKTSSSKKRGV